MSSRYSRLRMEMEKYIQEFSNLPGEEGWKFDVDWRRSLHGVRNQFQCASCWAMSACEAIECQECEKNRKAEESKPEPLSPQDLVNNLREKQDRRKSDDSCGCYYNSFESTFRYIIKNGVQRDKHCPYIGKRPPADEIPHRSESHLTKIASYDEINPKSEDKILEKLKKFALPAAVEDCKELKEYKGGFYTGPKKPSSKPIYHGVLIVARARDADGVLFWLVLNSWGKKWGENGFMRIPCLEGNKGMGKLIKTQGKENAPVLTQIVYPVLEKEEEAEDGGPKSKAKAKAKLP